MRNRALQVRMVKTDPETTPEPEVTLEKKFDIIASHIAVTSDNLIKRIGLLAIGYVIVDTARQVLVAQASKTRI